LLYALETKIWITAFNFAFKFNLRRFSAANLERDHAVTQNLHNELHGNQMDINVNVNTRGLPPVDGMRRSARVPPPRFGVMVGGRGLHSSTSQLNLSRF
jgi:hypothetical protein